MELFKEEVKKDERVTRYLEGLQTMVSPGYLIGTAATFNASRLEKVISEVFKAADQARSRGKKVYPASSSIFRAFKECELSSARVVFIGQDPYHQAGVADGLAFSCSKTSKEQPSLKFVFDEIQRTVYKDKKYTRDVDLVRWARQGVLLLNTALTVEQGKPDSHTEIWRPWMTELIENLSRVKDGSIFVFFGKKAQYYTRFVDPNRHHKFHVVHPAAAAHRGGVWDCEDVFNKINNILLEQGKNKIVW